MRSRWQILWSFLAGVLLLVAAPPMDVAACVWIALAWLAYLLDEPSARSRWSGGVARGLAFGMGANLVAFRFMPGVVTHFTTLGTGAALATTVLLALLHALRWGLAGWVHVQLARRGVPSPLAFAAALYISTFVPAMIPWMPVDGATSWLPVVQVAEVIGERGLQAIVALVAALAALALRLRRRERETRRPLLLIGAALSIHLLLLLFGKLRLADVEAHLATLPHVKVALVAPDVAASLRWDESEAPELLFRLTDLTRTAEVQGAAFTVWPEAAYPYLLDRDAAVPLVGDRAPVPAPLHGPVLSGVMVHAPEPGALTNSATVFTREGLPTPRYDKMHLLWFGETVPLAEEIPWIKQTFARGTGLVAGTTQVPLTVGPARVAVLDCFEDTLPSAGREAMGMTPPPQLLVNLTNDAWFLGSAESELHLNMAQMRAIETRRDIVRAVNYGKTSWIDAGGRVRAELDDWQPAFLLVEPALSDDPPCPYARFGDAPFALCLILGLTAAVARARSPSRVAPSPT